MSVCLCANVCEFRDFHVFRGLSITKKRIRVFRQTHQQHHSSSLLCGSAHKVMTLLGQSIWDLFASSEGRFSLMTVLMLADQMISRLQEVHSVGIVHRDVKPDNFLMDLETKWALFT